MSKTIVAGKTVAFAQSVIKRTGSGAGARGTVLSVSKDGKIARVDFHGTWIEHEDGGTVRSVPTANLTPVLSSGVVFGD